MKKKKAIFLDRDGTIIVHHPYLSSPGQLQLLPNAAEGIRTFKEYGYLAIVVTNQSGIARGFFDEERLMLIHEKLKVMLEKEGAPVDDFYYCPHLPCGIIKQYSIDCGCRKPKPLMLLEASRKHHIDLTQSVMIGDSETDIIAGKRAGCKCVRVINPYPVDTDIDTMVRADYVVKDILEAAGIFTAQKDTVP